MTKRLLVTTMALLAAVAAAVGQGQVPKRALTLPSPKLPPARLAAGEGANPGATRPALNPFEAADNPTPEGPLDKLAFPRLKQLGLEPAKVCSDAVFVRRVYLDVIGTLPTAQEARDFLQDKDPNKRSALIDRLLERDEFADYWAMKWSDLLRVKAEFPIDLWPNAVQGYHRWIHEAIKKNLPYDQFVRALLTTSGSNFRVPEVNFYRAVQSKDPRTVAQAVALTFMGVRAENWPKDRLAGLAGFFTHVGYKYTQEWKEEIIYFDPERPGAATQPAAMFPDGTPAKLLPDRDPRVDFADWLTAPQNPWFARNIVNRVWSWLLGRGIINEPDDIRPDNPPSNPELLAYLEGELVGAKYDLKHIYRLILNSRTYQLSSIAGKKSDGGRDARPTNPDARPTNAEANFASYPLRRLEAEVLIDALDQITGTTEKYSSPIPEPFTFIPESQRSITLADGSTTSSFLEMFGRPPRDTGWESERNNRTTPNQRLYFLNSSHIQGKLEKGRKLQDLLQKGRSLKDTVTELYLTVLSRFPTDEEWKIAESYAQSAKAKREALVDLAWALINSPEFLYRH